MKAAHNQNGQNAYTFRYTKADLLRLVRLTPAAGGGADRRAVARESQRDDRDQRSRARRGGYHRAGESGRASDRRPARPPRSRGCSVCQREGVGLHQNYRRVAKRAAIMDWRYTRALQLKRARRQLKFLHKRLGRVVRDLRRKIEGKPALEDRLGPLLDLAWR